MSYFKPYVYEGKFEKLIDSDTILVTLNLGFGIFKDVYIKIDPISEIDPLLCKEKKLNEKVLRVSIDRFLDEKTAKGAIYVLIDDKASLIEELNDYLFLDMY